MTYSHPHSSPSCIYLFTPCSYLVHCHILFFNTTCCFLSMMYWQEDWTISLEMLSSIKICRVESPLAAVNMYIWKIWYLISVLVYEISVHDGPLDVHTWNCSPSHVTQVHICTYLVTRKFMSPPHFSVTNAPCIAQLFFAFCSCQTWLESLSSTQTHLPTRQVAQVVTQ